MWDSTFTWSVTAEPVAMGTLSLCHSYAGTKSEQLSKKALQVSQRVWASSPVG